MSQDDQHQRLARSFGGVAEVFERGRPGYPDEAVHWLLGSPPEGQSLSVLELGAGTGKLTERLVAMGHDVHATDPDRAMLEVLQQRLPDVRTSVGSAEEVPSPDHSYDVVVAAQSWHWFDHDRALDEVRRVLKPRGRYSMVWNTRDEKIPWVKKLGRIIGTPEQDTDPTELLDSSLKFIIVEQATFRQWQQVDRRSIVDLVASRSHVAVLPDDERTAVVDQVLDLYDSYGRGMDGMQLPYLVQCFRSRVVKSPPPPPKPVRAEVDDTDDDERTTTAERPAVSDAGVAGSSASDDGTLLIDFR